MISRPARTPPRTVLLGAALFVAAGSGLYLAAPWLLPVRILEGPLVQQAGEEAATLIWYTTRPLAAGESQLVVELGSQTRAFAVETYGRRNRVRITGLTAGQVYPYRIGLGRRTLASGSLHTNRASGSPVSFIVFGDSGSGSAAQYQLAGHMLSFDGVPDFVLHTGDLVYERGERSAFKDRFFVPYRRLLAQVNFWPALGNHDAGKPDFGQPYFDVFELPENGPPGLPPERNYWFDYASARIAVVDSNADETTLAQRVAPWLRDALGDGTATWKFVALHHPPYTAGKYAPDPRIQRTLVPIFEAVGVDIVFCGHDHLYERTHPLRGGQVVPAGEGVVYVVTGAGGGELYQARPPEQRPAYLAALNDQRHSFTHVRINGDELRLRQVDLADRVLDDWTTVKTR